MPMFWLLPPSGYRFFSPLLEEIIFLIWFLGVLHFARGVDSDIWSLITYWLFIIIIWHAKLLASAMDQRDATDTYIKKSYPKEIADHLHRVMKSETYFVSEGSLRRTLGGMDTPAVKQKMFLPYNFICSLLFHITFPCIYFLSLMSTA